MTSFDLIILIDECDTDTDNCDMNCTNTNGSFVCACRSLLDGREMVLYAKVKNVVCVVFVEGKDRSICGFVYMTSFENL